jgi:hypothetical protein
VAEVGRFRRRGRPFEFVRGAPSPGRYPPDELTIAKAIEAIRHAPVEVGYGFDAAGRQDFRQVGDGNEIRGFAERDLATIADGTFVHNHPPYGQFALGDPRWRAGSFSARDLVFMYEAQLAEMIAVTAERTYFVQPRPDGFFLDSGQIWQEYADAVDDTRLLLRSRAMRGMMSIEEAASPGRIADEVMDLLSPYFQYRWVEGSEDGS